MTSLRLSPRRAMGLALGAVVLLFAGCSAAPAGAPPTATAPGAEVGTRLDSALPARILDLPFTTSDGRSVTLRNFTGKVVAISDVMTLCQETCPVDTATFVQTARAEDSSGGSKAEVFLSITVDPGRDTASQLAAYRRLYAPPPPNWLALTGSQQSIDTLWNFLGVYRQMVGEPPGPKPHDWRTGKALTYDVQHSDEVFFLDRSTHERFILEGPPYSVAGSVPQKLRTFMSAKGRADLATPPSTDWTEAQARNVLAWLKG